MQKHEAQKVTKQILTDIRCNRCGKDMALHRCKNPSDPKKEMVNEVLGLRASIDGCYDSTHLEDCINYKFELCEECLLWLFGTFEIPVEKNGIILIL